MNLSPTAYRAINAYGGPDLWKGHQSIEAAVSVKGLAFKLKQRPFFEHAIIKMDVNRPYSTITPIGKDLHISGILDANKVSIQNSDGVTISERDNARDFFPYGRRLFYWDDLDMSYFANYALWNYFTLPALLMNNSIQWIEKKNGVLSAIFPKDFPTHCTNQDFIFDTETGFLLQHNYTVDIISKLAKAANVVREHKRFAQGIFPSARIVTPQNSKGNATKFPVLVDIEIHDFNFKVGT